MQSAPSPDALKAAQALWDVFDPANNEPDDVIAAMLHCVWQRDGVVPQALNLIVQRAVQSGHSEAFARAAQDWLVLHPATTQLRAKLVGVYLGMKDQAAALPHLQHLVEQDGAQGDANVMQAYVQALHATRQLQACVDTAQKAQATFPAAHFFYNMQGLALCGLGRHGEAREVYQRGIAACENAPSFHTSQAVLDFMLSDLRDGHEQYRERFNQYNALKIPFEIAQWRGEDLSGKRVLIHEEQGIGDMMMWATLLPKLVRSAQQVTLALCRKLQPLFARSFPEISIIDYESEGLLKAQHAHDVVLPMAALMHYVLPHYVPASQAAVFKADERKVTELRARYMGIAAQRGAKKLVGISWYTNSEKTGLYRNIPLAQWRPIFEVPGVQYVSLQYGECAQEIAQINEQLPGVLYDDAQVDALADTDTLAAQVAAMDEVMTIQNSTSHLGGALGVPTTLMLSVASSWRFGLKRLDNAWYQSLRIERQDDIFEWEPVIARVAKRLRGEHV